ncbi:hypothetical protein UF64_07565 [Thalassospira sp. HJ]|uniref:non-hydrolyzing UDP-N-acetylglucosamine 2-epimerase n=1 Tax=Thalassospira sp. HJ TaxID=1616823 RepID=UPI0005CE2CCD|nr:UDP-N-acetylglucosamine 2-epimerase (non-hydrolyzing) [Thalassospira sp. HJ]KJE35941.1 hypothetical protein UF64_07565 [Thalassospira sp. HJ]
MKLHLIAGARPNFMKIAPLWRGLVGHPFLRPSFVHTAQHCDDMMSLAIWREIGLPDPDHVLNWEPSESGDPVADMMRAYEALCHSDRPDVVLVVGDVNSSRAAAMVSAEMNIPLVHLEAGLRCFDPDMTEEQNRIVIDHKADLLLTPSADADQNLLAEGVEPGRIKLVGNIMADTLEMMRPKIDQEDAASKVGVDKWRFVLVTLHRQNNVDDPEMLGLICQTLKELAAKTEVCFVLHPRSEKRLAALSLIEELSAAGVRLLPPMGYVEFASLMRYAGVVVTDSGGVQEETTCLGVPCLTLRRSTERPVTITKGTNRLVDIEGLLPSVMCRLQEMTLRRRATSIPFWDGKATGRIINVLEEFSAS